MKNKARVCDENVSAMLWQRITVIYVNVDVIFSNTGVLRHAFMTSFNGSILLKAIILQFIMLQYEHTHTHTHTQFVTRPVQI